MLGFGRWQFGLHHPHFLEQLVSPLCLRGIDAAYGESDVHHDVVANSSFGNKIKTGLANNASELDSARTQAAMFGAIEDLSGNRQAHRNRFYPRRLLRRLTPVCDAGHNARAGVAY